MRSRYYAFEGKLSSRYVTPTINSPASERCSSQAGSSLGCEQTEDGAGLGDHPPRAEDCLTKKGQELSAVVRAMSEWGFTYEPDDEARATGRIVDAMAKLGARRRNA